MKTSYRILVVEDEENIAKLLTRVFESYGWDVDTAADGEAGLRALEEARFDIMVVDKNLPGMDGIELLGRANELCDDMESILITAFPDMKSVLAAMSAGAYDYLLKPFDNLDDVALTVRRALEKREMTRENKRLVEQLEETNRRLTAFNKDLEDLVEERTQQLEKLSLTDDVTGLYNQRFLYQRLEEEHHRARRYERRLSVLMLDIDNFKQVNDTHDHIFGSRVLKRVGTVLQRAMRGVDVVIRYGGDEFVIILPETDAQGALLAAERLRQSIEQADVGDRNKPYQVTISCGVASLHESTADTASALLQAADRAMYGAKENGRNRVFVMNGKEAEPVSA